MSAALVVDRDRLPAEAFEQPNLPPHDLEAEAAVLSAVMLDPDALGRVVDFLSPTHFYAEPNRLIYEAAIFCRDKGVAIDTTTVSTSLRDHKRLASVGGAAYLQEILDSTPAPRNVRDHAVIVFEKWRARSVQQLAHRAVAYGYQGVPDVQAYADGLARAAAELARQQPGKRLESNIDTLKRLVSGLYETSVGRDDGQKRGIPTGIAEWDERTLGLHAGRKITIVARPRVGKTALALQIAMNVARSGIGVLFFSTEMSRDELAVRQLSALAGIDGKRLQTARQKPCLTVEDWRSIHDTMRDREKIGFALTVVDTPSITVEEIVAKVKSHAEQSMIVDGVPLGLVIVDYVQNLRASETVARRKKHEQVEHATRRLKNLARETKLPIIELAQQKPPDTNRSTGKSTRPMLGDARDSQEIEISADDVIYLYRPQERDGNTVRLFIAKQRSGEEGEWSMMFERKMSRFVTPDARHEVPTSRQYVASDDPLLPEDD